MNNKGTDQIVQMCKLICTYMQSDLHLCCSHIHAKNRISNGLSITVNLAVIHRCLSYQGSELPFGNPWFGRYTQVTVLSRFRATFWKAMVWLLYTDGCLIKVQSNLLESHGLAVIHRWLSYQGSEQPFGKPWFGCYTQIAVSSRFRATFKKAMVWLLNTDGCLIKVQSNLLESHGLAVTDGCLIKVQSNLLESHGLAVIHKWLSYQGSEQPFGKPWFGCYT